MAATYGYGGEFSSDEDIDRMEQQAERLAQSKFDLTQAKEKLTKVQIEEAIEIIRKYPVTYQVPMSDELIAALLDHYNISRGPIVESTRKLYIKIVLRYIHENLARNGDQAKESNGSGDTDYTNNNDLDIVSKIGHTSIVEAHSSDEDEPMPPVTSQTGGPVERSGIDSSPVVSNINDKGEPMEVDSEVLVKPAYRASVEEESDGEDESDEDQTQSSSDEVDSTDSEAPVKSTTQQANKTVQKQEEVVKKQTVRQQKQNETSSQKKPYTRSQRVAATRAGSAIKSKKTDVSSSKADGVAHNEGVTGVAKSGATKHAKTLYQKLPVKFLLPTVVVALLAFLLFYFKSDLNKLTDGVFFRTSFKFTN